MKRIIVLIIFLCLLGYGSYFLYNQYSYSLPEEEKTITLFNEGYREDITSLDLTNIDIKSDDNWISKIGEFKKLKHINFGKQSISIELKEELQQKYPNIDFDVVATVNVYEKEVLDNIKELDLKEVNVDNKLKNIIKKLPQLESVDLTGVELTEKQKLELVNELPNIYFIWNVKILDKEVPSSTTKLDFSNQKIEKLDEFVNELKLIKKLSYLNMSNTNLTNEELDSIRKQLPGLKVVWTIHFGVWSMSTDTISFSTLVGGFHYVRLTNEDISVLKYCTDLKALDLGHQDVTDLSIITDNFPDIRVLILADNKKLSDLKPLTKLKHLHYLELFLDNITDITPLTELKELVDLNLSFNRSLTDITPLIENPLPMVERIWLPGCPIPEEQIELLKKAYPNAKIVTKGNGSTGDGWRSIDRYQAMMDMFRKRNYISDIFLEYDK